MGVLRHIMRDGQMVLVEDSHVLESDDVEELDCSVNLFKLLKKNGYERIEQVTAQSGMTIYEMEGMGMKALKELFQRLDSLGFRLSNWSADQSVDDYYSTFAAIDKQRIKERLEEDIRAERRERARIRARERRAKQKLANAHKVTEGGMLQ